LSSQIQWRSNIDGLLGTGASLTYSMLSPGMHTISARVTDASGLAAEAHITVVVAHPPMVGIAAPADGSVYYVTDLPVSLAGQATDVEDGDLSANIHGRLALAPPLRGEPRAHRDHHRHRPRVRLGAGPRDHHADGADRLDHRAADGHPCLRRHERSLWRHGDRRHRRQRRRDAALDLQ